MTSASPLVSSDEIQPLLDSRDSGLLRIAGDRLASANAGFAEWPAFRRTSSRAERSPSSSSIPGIFPTVDYGEVGDIETVDTAVLDQLLPSGVVPVIASLAADAQGRPLNVNADSLAEALARSLKAKKLVFMTGAPGLLRDLADPASLVAFATPDDLIGLLASGEVRGGMRPKVEACLRAVAGGVRRTHIIDGRAPDALLVELITGHGCGTMIVASREALEYEAQEW